MLSGSHKRLQFLSGLQFAAANHGAGRVLVVEDEFIIARDVMQQLVALNFQIVGHAVRADEGFRLAEKLMPDLLLTDIRLEDETDGVDLAIKVRRQLGIPAIIISASLTDDVRQRASFAQPVACLHKPLYEEELRLALQKAVCMRSRPDLATRFVRTPVHA